MKAKFDITKFRPCRRGLEFYESHDTFEEAWSACEIGDCMLWMAYKLGVDDRLLTKAKALCANTVRHLMTDKRSRAAVDAALRYANGKISSERLYKYADEARAVYSAYSAAPAAAYSSDFAAHAAAARAAAHVANAADNAAARAAADAAGYAADAADASFADARRANRLQAANICREVLTAAVLEKVKQAEGYENDTASEGKPQDPQQKN
jgi:hypothetical protein